MSYDRFSFYMYHHRMASYSTTREAVDDLYLHYVLGCAHEQKAHGPQRVVSIGMANINAVFVTFMGLTKRFKAYESVFQRICCTIDCTGLRVTQMPSYRSPELAILQTTLTDDRQNQLPLAHACQVLWYRIIVISFPMQVASAHR